MDPILIVEDSKSFASLLAARIKNDLNIDTVVARSLAEATAAVEKAAGRFSLGILDLNLPDAPHGEIVDYVVDQKIPGIVLTGEYDKNLRKQILTKNVLDYFIKDNIHVIDAVIYFIDRLRKNREIRTLVVDDSRSFRGLMYQFLKRYGFKAMEASGGEAALEILANHEVHLVITDYEMPGMNGIQLTKKIRQNHSREHVAIIGLSSHGSQNMAIEFIKAGANDFLAKPFQNEELFCRVSQNIEIIEHSRKLESLVQERTKKLKEAHTQLQVRENHLRSVLDMALDAIISIGLDGKITEFNPAAEKLFGYAKNAMVGQSLAETLIPPEFREPYQLGLNKWLSWKGGGEGLKRRLEVSAIRADGGVLDLELALTSIESAGQISITGFMHDISDRKQLVRSLRDTLEVAESSNRAKSAFLANMSHEIRTPMNAIIGFSDLALATHLEARTQDYLAKIAHASRSLLRIIDDILDFSKVDSGKLTLESKDFHLSTVYDHLADMFRSQVAEKGLELVMMASPECRYILTGDQTRLEQILMNLLGNAVKFTEKGEITVQIRTVKDMLAKVVLEFSVQDEGIGMHQDQVDQLFQAFVQADNSLTRKYGGTGLGLAISKRLTNLMGGQIWVESTRGHGSVFRFTLEFQRQKNLEVNHLVAPHDLQSLRILIAHNNLDLRNALQSMLEAFHYSATHVSLDQDAIAAVRAAQTRGIPYQLVLLGFRTAEIRGVEIAAQIVKAARPPQASQQPKILLLTGYGGPEELQAQASAVGADASLLQPVTCSLLLNAIVETFGQKIAKVCKPESAITDASAVIQHIGGAQVLLVDDNAINRQVGREILTNIGLVVQEAVDGVEAVKMVGETTFDAVLMDIQMPKMDGYTATAHIRQNPQFKDLPIIAMTAHAMTGDREKCLAAGMDDYVTKPIDTERLYPTLLQWIKPQVRTSTPTIPEKKPEAEEPIPDFLMTLPGIDTPSALKRLNHNQKLFRSVILEFCRDFASIGARIRSALASKSRADRVSAKQWVHSVKGVSGNISAKTLFQAAVALESAIVNNRAEEWSTLLKDFDDAMGQVVESANRIQREVEAAALLATAETEPADPNVIISLIRELDKLIHANDPEAQEVFNRLKPMLSGAEILAVAQRLEAALDIFNFEDADIDLNTLAEFFAIPAQEKDDLAPT